MNKRYIVFITLLCASIVPIKAQQVIGSMLYRTITPTNLDNGITITKPGSYLISGSTTISNSGGTLSQETATVNSATTTKNGVIVVATNNVTIDFNGTNLKTDKDALVAVYVNDGLSNVTVENGTISSGNFGWNSAVIVGDSCSNVSVKNMTINGCTGSDGSVNIKGLTTKEVQNVNLYNVSVLESLSNNGSGIICSFANSVTLKNIKSNNASITGTYDAIKLRNCIDVNATNVKANNNSATGTIQGLYLLACDGIELDTISTSSNTSSTGTITSTFISSCKGIECFNLQSNNNSGTTNSDAINIFNCDSVNLEAVTASNNSCSAKIHGIVISLTKNLEAQDIDAQSNTGTGSTMGLKLLACKDASINNLLTSNGADTTTVSTKGMEISFCSNIKIDQFEANNLTNTRSGITLSDSSNISMYNSSISNCVSDDYLEVIDGGDNLKNIKFVNCSITNNTAVTFIGADLDFIETIYLENVNMNFNTSTNDTFIGLDFIGTTNAHLFNCSISNNTVNAPTSYTLLALFITTSTNILLDSCTFSHNKDTYNTDGNFTTDDGIAGVFISDSADCKVVNCDSSNNTGTEQAYGFYILEVDNAEFINCTANGNAALSVQGAGGTDTDGVVIDPTAPSAGFYVYDCNYCTFDSCTANSNKAGNHAPGRVGADDVIDVTQSCSGFGFMNMGTSTSNLATGNVYRNCTANGNGTGLDTTITATNGGVYTPLGTGPDRYWLSEACAGGFVDQWGQSTEFTGCTANNNGLQDNVLSYGFLVTGSKQANIKYCKASNNWFYGFVDDGAQRSSLVNAETTLFANYACMNGEQNSHIKSILYNPPGAIAAGVTDGHLRNYWLYFSEEGQDIPIKRVAFGGQGMAQIPGNILFNISMAYDA